MTWVTILWPMVTGASVTMALIHLRIGRRLSTWLRMATQPEELVRCPLGQQVLPVVVASLDR